MKKLFIPSLILNILFFLMIVLSIHKRGGIEYIKRKAETEPILTQALKYDKDISGWNGQKSLFELLPDTENEIIFLGNSLTNDCEWSELLNIPNIKNRGVSGDDTEGILNRINEVLSSKPKSIFLEVGLNDLIYSQSINMIKSNYDSILTCIKITSPKTKVFIQSILPVSPDINISPDSIMVLNNELINLSLIKKVPFINLYNSFVTDKYLRKELTYDGIHLNGQGYLLWAQLLKPFLNK